MAAVAGLSRLGTVAGVSRLYETAPMGGPPQGRYLNAAVALDTGLDAGALLDRCLTLEQERGRARRVRMGPRTLDLDLLLFGLEEHRAPGLVVPHPRLRQRRFALEPLLEAWPGAVLPDGTPVASWLPDVAGQEVEVADAGAWWEEEAQAGRSGSVRSSSPPSL